MLTSMTRTATDLAGDVDSTDPTVGLTHNLGGRPGRCVSFVGIFGSAPG